MKIREKPSYSTSYDTHASDHHRGKDQIITLVVINLNPTVGMSSFIDKFHSTKPSCKRNYTDPNCTGPMMERADSIHVHDINALTWISMDDQDVL